jgi:hypothetical protein
MSISPDSNKQLKQTYTPHFVPPTTLAKPCYMSNTIMFAQRYTMVKHRCILARFITCCVRGSYHEDPENKEVIYICPVFNDNKLTDLCHCTVPPLLHLYHMPTTTNYGIYVGSNRTRFRKYHHPPSVGLDICSRRPTPQTLLMI